MGAGSFEPHRGAAFLQGIAETATLRLAGRGVGRPGEVGLVLPDALVVAGEQGGPEVFAGFLVLGLERAVAIEQECVRGAPDGYLVAAGAGHDRLDRLVVERRDADRATEEIGAPRVTAGPVKRKRKLVLEVAGMNRPVP
jgi:hypothetical protein